MNVYVVMSWSKNAGLKCIGLNMNQRSAENMAMHAAEDFIRFTGCGGAVAESDDCRELWPENAPEDFLVRIETKKIFINFANC